MLSKIAAFIFNFLERASIEQKEREYRKRFNIHKTARLGYLPHIVFKGNIEIQNDSYFNSGRISTGLKSKVVIGEWCAIGHNVNIHAITHNPDFSTGPDDKRPAIEGNIIIGNNVWIGSNTFLLPGITIGNNSVIAANAVVNKDVPENAIVGGVPAKILRIKKHKDEETNQGFPKGPRT